jgi:hypothetical protein
MGKAKIVLEIVLLLQGTDLGNFARENLTVSGDRPVVLCALNTTLPTVEGQACKIDIIAALRGYSDRFSTDQLGVMADLYVSALDQLEPQAKVRVREAACDPMSDEAQFDSTVAQVLCERLSLDF